MKKLLIIPLLFISIFLSANVTSKSVVIIKVVEVSKNCLVKPSIVIIEKDGTTRSIELGNKQYVYSSDEVNKLIHSTISEYFNKGYKLDSHAAIELGCGGSEQMFIFTKEE